jgi:hypothetical protein
MITKIKKKRNEDKHVFGPSVQDCGVVDKYNVVSQRTREEERCKISLLSSVASVLIQHKMEKRIQSVQQMKEAKPQKGWFGGIKIDGDGRLCSLSLSRVN